MAIAILLWAVVFAPAPGETRWIRTLHNSAHAPIFGCVALLSLLLIRTRPRFAALSPQKQYASALAIAVGLGVLTEFVQMLTGRDASLEDALHDTIGAVAVLGLFAVFDERVRASPRTSMVRFASAVVGVAALAVAATPVTRAAIKYQQRDQRFPVLADFSERFDRYFILQQSAEVAPARMPAAWASGADEQAMHVRLLEGPYPGLHFIEVPPDWSAYSMLALDLTNPTELALQFVVRVHDATHNNQVEDRFNRVFELPPGTRQIVRIPLRDIAAGPRARSLDLRQVAGVIVFRTDESPRASELYFSRAWLE
ncbi:VanZ family protein [Steroidobacter sp. S1-65]|uniref:VanZ family protein n=1 Tax=Steroidobacter gossypii TaxID=2805490 RepID=A0ABS1X658_9GAMM|nr:VanZ family protein [Steroidobacter gossypii]MBM0108675.1 VanZ family protein [Steroidobacter gossypii]